MRKKIYLLSLVIASALANAQNVGIGVVNPKARLHVTDSSVLFSVAGEVPLDAGNVPVNGEGRRMMWYADKAAFRVGYVDAAQWDKDNIGTYSLASGYGSTASFFATTAMGTYAVASEYASTAIGYGPISSGFGSVSAGFVTTAKALGSFATGMLNDNTDSPDPYNISPLDRIFQIGNGANAIRNNAITVLRNGNTGIGTLTPNAPLQFSNIAANRKIVLWETANNDHQFYGFGINGSTLRYQTPSAIDDHVFYSGSGTNSSAELFRIKGNGNTGVGVSDPVFRLDVGDRMRIRAGAGSNSAGLWLNNDINTISPAFVGMKANDEVGFYGQTGTPGWRFYINTTTGNGWMQGTLTQNSDGRLKKDMAPLQHSLQKITQLNGYHYFWKDENADQRLQTGVVAQEVQQLFPELVTENKDGLLAVNYSGLIPVMIESFKEQQRLIEKQQQQIDEMKILFDKILKQSK